MPIYVSQDDLAQWSGDDWAQKAQSQVADVWAQQAVADAPDRAAAAEQAAAQSAAQSAAQQVQQTRDAAIQAAAQAQQQTQQANQEAADQWSQQATQTTAQVASSQTDASSLAPSQAAQQATIDSSSPEAFIRSVAPYAVNAAQRLGVPAAALIGMASNETGYGRYMSGNNLFGIKGAGPAGSINSPTWEDYGSGPVSINANFRAYTDPGQSFDDFANLISNSPRYAAALGQNSVEGFVNALKSGGYMTDPAYTGKISSIVQRFGSTINDALSNAGQSAGDVAQQGQQGVGDLAQRATGIVQNAVANVSQNLDLRPSQFQMGLSDSDAYAACGPAAAIAFARATGRNPTAQEALDLAKQVGWTPGQGMAGPSSEVQLLQKMGVTAHMEQGADPNKIIADVNSGNPVILSTPGHYFVADGYDPQSGAFHVGTSGTDLRSGSGWMSLGQMQQVMGNVQATLFLDRQPGDGPSIATQMSGQQPGGTTMGALQPAQPQPQSMQDFINQRVQATGSYPSDTELGNYILSRPSAQSAPVQPSQAQAPTSSPFDIVGQLANGVGGALSSAASGITGALGGLFGGGSGGSGGQPPQGPSGGAPGALSGPQMPDIGAAVRQGADTLGGLLPTWTPPNLDPNSAVARVARGEQPPSTLVGVLQSAGTPFEVAQQASSGLADAYLPADTPQPVKNALASALNPANLSFGAGGVGAAVAGSVSGDAARAAVAAAGGDETAQSVAQGLGNLVGGAVGPGVAGRAGEAALSHGLEGLDAIRPPEVAYARTGPVGGTYDQYGVLVGEEPPGFRGPAPTSGAGGAAAPTTGANVLQDALGKLEQYPSDTADAISQWANSARASGTADSDIGSTLGRWMQDNPPETVQGLEAQIPSVTRTPRPDLDQVPEVQAVRQAANPPAEVDPADNGLPPPPGTPPSTISTDPEDFDSNVQAAIEDKARKPGSFWQVLNALHSGNVIMAPATLSKVVAHSSFAPVWNLGTQSARDLLSLNIDRVVGRGIGARLSLVNIGNDLTDGFAQAMANRTTSSIPLVDAFLQAQHAVGGAPHAALQNMAAEAVRRMELGAAAGEQVAAQNGRGISGLSQIADLIRDPSGLSGDAVARANDLASRAGLRAPAGATQQTVQNMLNQAANTPAGAVTNFLMPVFRIGAQATARMVEASPVGLAGTGADVARGLAGFGPYARGFSQYGGAVTPLADRLTANIAGTAVTAWLASKALDGTVTGTGPDDPRARANLEAQGWRPQSVLVPGVGYVSYQRLPEQLKGPLMLAGAYGDAARDHPGDLSGTAQRMAQEVGSMFAQQAPGLSTLADVGGILKGDPYAVGYLVGGSAAGYIPGSALLGNVATAMDPYTRKIPTTQGFGPAIAANIQQTIPGLRQQLQPRTSVLGQPMPNPAAGLASVLPVRTPGDVAPGTPGVAALRVLNASGVVLGGAPKTVTLPNGGRVALSEDEQAQFEANRAVLLDEMTAGLANNQQFAAAPAASRKQVLDRIVSKADTVAGRQVVGAIAQAPDFASRLQGPARLQEPVPSIRPPLALAQLQPVDDTSTSTTSIRPPLPLTDDFSDLDPIQQAERRRRLAAGLP